MKSNSRKKIAILGGGLAGVVLAQELSQNPGFSIELYEKAAGLGGLHRCIMLKGLAFDIGPFLFSNHFALLEMFPFLASDFMLSDPKQVSITPQNKLDTYPISVSGYLKNNGMLNFLLSALDLLICKLKYRRPDTVSTYIKHFVGNRIFEQSGLKYYIQRFYGLPIDEIGLSFAMQRLHLLPKISPFKYALRALKELVYKPAHNQPRKKMTLVHQPSGFDPIYKKIQHDLKTKGIQFHFNASISQIKKTKNRFIIQNQREQKSYDRIVSTIPLPDCLKLIGNTSDSGCEYMNLISLFYTGKFKDSAVLFFNSTPQGKWKRITVFSQLYEEQSAEDYFTVEITTRDKSHHLVPGFQAEFEKQAQTLGLLAGKPKRIGYQITENAYPVFSKTIETRLGQAKQALDEFGIYHIGRQGDFEYLLSDPVIANAQAMAKKMTEDLQKKSSQLPVQG